MRKGFTIIELLVVISIIVVFTGIMLPNYKAGNTNLSLQRSAHKLSQDIRSAQEDAVSVESFNGQNPDGYGVYFDISKPTQYIIFADLNGDGLYSGSSELVETVTMESGVYIKSLSPTTGQTLTIFFSPPDPSVTFNPNTSLTSTVTLAAPEAANVSVQTNKAGLIYVQ